MKRGTGVSSVLIFSLWGFIFYRCSGMLNKTNSDYSNTITLWCCIKTAAIVNMTLDHCLLGKI